MGHDGCLSTRGTEQRSRLPRVVRFALDGPTLPPVTETLYLGEVARRYAQGVFGRLFAGASSPVLSGKRPDGSPLEGHRHAFFLPTDEDGDGLLDHLTIASAAGFHPDRELVALESLRQINLTGFSRLALHLLGLGEPDDFPDVPFLYPSAAWRSVTPYVPTRHYKRRGRKRDTGGSRQFLLKVVREDLARRGFPEPEYGKAGNHEYCPGNRQVEAGAEGRESTRRHQEGGRRQGGRGRPGPGEE